MDAWEVLCAFNSNVGYSTPPKNCSCHQRPNLWILLYAAVPCRCVDKDKIVGVKVELF